MNTPNKRKLSHAEKQHYKMVSKHGVIKWFPNKHGISHVFLRYSIYRMVLKQVMLPNGFQTEL